MLNDLRISLRGLLRAPMMTLTIVVTVGLGVGATTVIFAAVQAALLRPLTRLLSTLLFGVGAADAFTFAAVACLMLGVALRACFIPARRAIGVQPAEVLRAE